jgi:hypothetical protein
MTRCRVVKSGMTRAAKLDAFGTRWHLKAYNQCFLIQSIDVRLRLIPNLITDYFIFGISQRYHLLESNFDS